MKKARLLSILLLAAMSIGLLAACGNDGDADVFKIGVIQLTEHDALDSAYLGFQDELKALGVNVTYEFQNAQNDQSNCVTIANSLVNANCDLLLAIATPAAQALANATSDIPILVTAVTDPQSSGLVKSNDAPGNNVSGTSDLTPIAEQIDLLREMLPEAEHIGILYCTSESNSSIQLEITKKELDKAGLTYGELSVSNATEIQQVVQSAVGKYDAIYTFTDNTIAASMATVALVTNEHGIPVIVGEQGMCAAGGLATNGLNYYNLGRLTGAMAKQILVDGKDVSSMPIGYLDEADLDLMINEDVAAEIGYTISDVLKGKATLIQTAKTN